MSIRYTTPDRVILGDALAVLEQMASDSVNCCVTSPPYWGLRDYGVPGQIGLEETPEEYVEKMVAVFAEVRRVLRPDGTLWLNLGDTYNSGSSGSTEGARIQGGDKNQSQSNRNGCRVLSSIKPKDLVGIPWRVAFALQQDGWYLRQDIIWSKPNPMPESVQDRCTKAHEYIFMLTKSPRYFYDADAIRTPAKEATLMRWDQDLDGQGGSDRVPGRHGRPMKAVMKVPSGWKTGDGNHRDISGRPEKQRGHGRRHDGFNDRWDSMSREEQMALGANRRSVWTVATKPYKEAHFATFPPELIEPCILAGCPEGGLVLDPFLGSGTTAEVAKRLRRHYLGIEINAEYAKLIEKRLNFPYPML